MHIPRENSHALWCTLEVILFGQRGGKLYILVLYIFVRIQGYPKMNIRFDIRRNRMFSRYPMIRLSPKTKFCAKIEDLTDPKCIRSCMSNSISPVHFPYRWNESFIQNLRSRGERCHHCPSPFLSISTFQWFKHGSVQSVYNDLTSWFFPPILMKKDLCSNEVVS